MEEDIKLNVYKKYLVLPISRLNYCNNYLFFMTAFEHTTSKLQHMAPIQPHLPIAREVFSRGKCFRGRCCHFVPFHVLNTLRS